MVVEGTQYGCCPNSDTAKHDANGSNCTQPPPPGPPQPGPPPPDPSGGGGGPPPQPQSADITATTYTGAYGNSATAITGPQGNTAVITGGTSSSQIPAGDENLYILKSEVIPPVCPACPSMSSCPSQEPPPPCPPCSRCPEPAFDCKKVPNYSTNDDSYLPRPVLADFSQFGM